MLQAIPGIKSGMKSRRQISLIYHEYSTKHFGIKEPLCFSAIGNLEKNDLLFQTPLQNTYSHSAQALLTRQCRF